MKAPKIIATGAALAAGAVATVALVASCAASSGAPQVDDLQNVSPSYPNYAAIYMDVDGFPNVVMECIQGQGFALTTRDAAGAITPISSWNAFCKAQEGKQATQNGQP